jgi:hypothetical protein
VLILSFIFSILLLKQLALSKTHINQQELISLIAKLANISVITILTLLLCKNQSSLSNKEIELIPLVTGLTLIIVIFLKYKSMDISKSTVKI